MSSSRSRLVLLGAIAVTFVFVGCQNPAQVTWSSFPLEAQWAAAASPAPSDSSFSGLTTDTSGNVVACGYLDTALTFGFGTGPTITGYDSTNTNPLLVKFSPSGTVLWAATEIGGVDSAFNGVASDASSNFYTVGYVNGATLYDFGNGATVASTGGGAANSLIVKYNNAGVAQWAKSSTVGNSGNRFAAVAADPAGESFAVGYQRTSGSFSYGNGVQVSTSATWSFVVVKFDTNGVAQWISTVTTGTATSLASAVAADSSGYSYVAGVIETNAAFGFGTVLGTATATATGANNGTPNANGVLVKYAPNGTALWAQTPAGGTLPTAYNGVAVDSSGNSFAAGYLYGGGTQDFGNGQTATAGFSGSNAVAVKYDSNGVTQWVKTIASGPGASVFNAASVDSSGNLYVAGTITGPGTYDFGNGQTLVAPATGLNLVIVKYRSNGTTQLVYTVLSATSTSGFNAVATDGSGNLCAAGNLGPGSVNLGNRVTSTGGFSGTGPSTFSGNAFVVKYH